MSQDQTCVRTDTLLSGERQVGSMSQDKRLNFFHVQKGVKSGLIKVQDDG